MKSSGLHSWKLAAIIGTLLIAISFPLAYWQGERKVAEVAAVQTASATYVGSQKCLECHNSAWQKWHNSDHDKAMDIATSETVLGDFDNVSFEHDGYSTLFFKNGEEFYVNTEGPDGSMADFQVKYVFGVDPLQQYLIEFPGGRYQVLGVSWDAEQQRWYDMYPDQDIEAGDWLHWTRQAQNWNSMCAECHSTNLVKGYDPGSDSYKTTWSDIDVGCEACHGPGSKHLDWAAVPEMGRAESANFELTVVTRDMSSQQQADFCANCHSRRYLLQAHEADNSELLDYAVPSLLQEGLYHADGQILDEVYVYGSFVQSKMFNSGVKCSDCHDVHSLERHKEGNDLCLQCHQEKIYNSSDHHFHKQFDQGKPSDGWLCVKCHMPEKPYMVIDWRADHSIRIPRPDLSAEIGVPNACNDCHSDKTVDWSMKYIDQWYGKRKRFHYGSVFDKARKGIAGSETALEEVFFERKYVAIVRATAVSLLNQFPGETTFRVLKEALGDEESLVRLTALRLVNNLNFQGLGKEIFSLLYDPVAAVRAEAAFNLPQSLFSRLNEMEQATYVIALQEYRDVMLYSADFTFGQFNLGNLAAKQGYQDNAEKYYLAAIAIDELFYPAQINLAFLYYGMGRKSEAEALFRKVVANYPDNLVVEYNLGLLLAEEKNYAEAAIYLQRAADALEKSAPVFFNLGQVFALLDRHEEALVALRQAVSLLPSSESYFTALIEQYLKLGRKAEAFLAVKEAAEDLSPGYLRRIHDYIERYPRK